MAFANTETLPWTNSSFFTQVDVTKEAEVEFWSRRLGVSIGKLKQAVRAVGPQVKDLERHLSIKR